MIMNKKYLALSLFFVVNLSLHSFVHHDHFNFGEESVAKCQACEENVEVKVEKARNKDSFKRVKFLSNLFIRFVNSNKYNTDLPRAPPLN